MAFQFRLATVLMLRKRIEEERALSLARMLRLRAAVANALEARRRDTEAARQALVTAAAEGLWGVEVRDLAEHAERAARAAEAATAQLLEAGERCEVARTSLVKSSQDREVLEHLEDRHRDAERQRLDAIQSRHLDDVASIYHLWRSTGRRPASR